MFNLGVRFTRHTITRSMQMWKRCLRITVNHQELRGCIQQSGIWPLVTSESMLASLKPLAIIVQGLSEATLHPWSYYASKI